MLATLTFPALPGARAAWRRQIVRAHSAEDLRRALRAARESALSLDTSTMDRLLRLDRSRERLECQAATPWAAIAAYLGADAAALATAVAAGATPDRVGDAISSNTAGPDGAPVVAHVESITVVTADGELRRADRECNPDLFRLAVGGYGLFGVLYSVTLRIDSLLCAVQNAQPPVELALAESGAANTVLRSAEVFAPPEQLDRILSSFKALAAERRLALQTLQVRRLQAENETFLRWANRAWAGLTIRFRTPATLGASVLAAEIESLLLEVALSHGGSFPIAGAHTASLAQLQSCYPRLSAFMAEKRRFDPAERLQNRWYRRVCKLLRGEPRTPTE